MTDYFEGYFKGKQRIVRKSFCVYFDILGFSEKVKSSFSGPRNEYAFFEKYMKILTDEIDFIRKYGNFGKKSYGRFSIKIFTDNFVIGYPLYDDSGESELANLFTVVSHIQTTFIENDIFIRGAIALSDLHMDEFIVLGPALLEAYDLESKKAKTPRVILSPDVENLVKVYTGYYMHPHESPTNQSYIRDKDGLVFLNYLHKFFVWNNEDPAEQESHIVRHMESVVRNAHQNRDNFAVLEKYIWVAEYHNYFVDHFMEGNVELKIDLSFIQGRMRQVLGEPESEGAPS